MRSSRSSRRSRFLRVVVASTLAATVTVAVAQTASAKIVGRRVVGELQQTAAFTFDDRGRIWTTERFSGRILMVNPGSEFKRRFFKIDNVVSSGEQGLVGIELHPNFPDAPWVYAYVTRSVGGRIVDQLVRIRSEGGRGTRMQVLLSASASSFHIHSGGRILFGPDGMLYVFMGDASSPTKAQRLRSLRGKILRVTPWGGVPDDNPIAGSRVYAYGLRNSFGTAFDPGSRRLWETENGPECNDELNRIIPGRNYGWGPNETCSGEAPRNTNQDGPDPVMPERWFTPTIGPTGAAFCTGCELGARTEGQLLFGDYNDGTLWRATLAADRLSVTRLDRIARPTRHFTSMEVGPSGRIYFCNNKAIYRLVRT